MTRSDGTKAKTTIRENSSRTRSQAKPSIGARACRSPVANLTIDSPISADAATPHSGMKAKLGELALLRQDKPHDNER